MRYVKVRCLTAVIGTLLQCKYFSVDDYEALITKVAQYANKLLKKPDQCRMVSLCSHLFWPQLRAVEGPERFADCDRVLECMQRSLKIASVCDPNLFVEILDRYVEVPFISVQGHLFHRQCYVFLHLEYFLISKSQIYLLLRKQ